MTFPAAHIKRSRELIICSRLISTPGRDAMGMKRAMTIAGLESSFQVGVGVEQIQYGVIVGQ